MSATVRTFESIDAHAAGEPLRVIVKGVPPIPGATLLEKRRFLRDRADWIRTSLLLEPRGHADMYGCVITEPVTEDGDLGVLFLHNEGYSTMCGHGIIGLATVIVEEGLPLPGGRKLAATDRGREDEIDLRIDTPAGRVTARALRREGRVESVSFDNVPSFAAALDRTANVPGIGEIGYDLAFGGAYYAFCDAVELGLDLSPTGVRDLIEVGRAVKAAVAATETIVHPEAEDLGFLYGAIFVGPPRDVRNHSRNVCVFADGEVDRSPTGTGVSARIALHVARGEAELGEPLVVESILGTTFEVSAVARTRVGDRDAVVPRVSGQAFITGRSEFRVDPRDPLGRGFLLR